MYSEDTEGLIPDLDDYLSRVLAKVEKKDGAIRDFKKRITQLKNQSEKVNEIVDLDKATDLTKEECKILIDLLIALNGLVLEEYKICYMRGFLDGTGVKKMFE